MHGNEGLASDLRPLLRGDVGRRGSVAL